jgi:LysM repeat protein
MNFWVWLIRGLTVVLLCVGTNGCLPSSQGDYEEEKEVHYLTGRNCLNSMNFSGAAEAFESAVEVNPRSASAHFQLGCLYEEKEPRNPAAAIYHYDQFLKWRPGSDKAEFVKQRIRNCKQDLANSELPLPISAGMQREFEKLAEDNKRLREDNESLRAQLASRSPVFPTNPPALNPVRPSSSSPVGSSPRPPSASVSGGRPVPATGRTHTVQAGETPMAIARKYGVKLDDLLRANPGLDAKRLRPGKTLNLPPN